MNLTQNNTLHSSYDLFVLNCIQRGLNDKTIGNYTYIYNKMISVMNVNSLCDVDARTINEFAFIRSNQKKLGHVNVILFHLREIFDFYYGEDIIDERIKINLIEE